MTYNVLMAETIRLDGTPLAPRQLIWLALRDIAPVMLAAMPFGIVFAALAAKTGLPFDQIMLMSGLIFAGASQFAALELWSVPPPFWLIVFSVLAVNFRHVLYSAALGRKMHHWPAVGRYGGFALMVDPVFALSELRGGARLSGVYYAAIAIPLYIGWLAATALGALFGRLIEDPKVFGLDFVLAAYFIFLVAQFRERPNALPIIAASAAMAIAGYFVIGPPWHIAFGAFAGIAAAAGLAGGRVGAAA
ncbi:MAG TPA: AzlC family ABC transporter permease [Afifellaceae bacterium]|nr:AzlC family ABC transporter permease [Afifellaceae bacterium]